MRYRHIDALFGELGRNVIDWQLIEAHYADVMRAVLSWCRFGNAGVIAANDPEEQEKILKFSTLMTNAVIFHTTVDMMTVIRELIAEGWQITPADLAVLSPYVTARIQRFGVYATDEIALTPEPFNAHLGIDLAAAS